MNGLARSCWIAAPIYLLIGMVFGIWMSASGDHTLAPAHAHLNLIGWVTIALLGTFYTLRPEAAKWTISRIQVALMNLAVILMFPGIIMALTGQGDLLAKIGSMLAVVSVAAFLYIIIRATKST